MKRGIVTFYRAKKKSLIMQKTTGSHDVVHMQYSFYQLHVHIDLLSRQLSGQKTESKRKGPLRWKEASFTELRTELVLRVRDALHFPGCVAMTKTDRKGETGSALNLLAWLVQEKQFF